MTRLTHAWRAMEAEQRLAALAALALLVTMFFPWYGLQSLNRKTGVIHSHSINAFGDVSFVEAAIFLVAAGVGAMLIARAEGRDFHLPGGDGAIVLAAGAWAGLLIFFRVFSRPAGNGYPVGIEWGFFLAFVAAGVLTYAGWRMRATEPREPPLVRPRGRRGPPIGEDVTVVAPSPQRGERAAPVPARGPQPSPASQPVVTQAPRTSKGTTPSPPPPQSAPPSSRPAPPARAAGTQRRRPRYPAAPSDQLSFEDHPPTEQRRDIP